jgi:hypothetical protein
MVILGEVLVVSGWSASSVWATSAILRPVICCPIASRAFRPITEHGRRSSRDSRQAARSDVETGPSDTLIMQQSHSAKSWGAEVFCSARGHRAHR